jgi:hypothetical protein
MNADELTHVPTSVLVEQTVALARREPVLQSDEYWAHVRVLHFRTERDVFEEAVGLCSSPDVISRAVGADILAQLGVRDGIAVFPFADESAGTLVALLTDTEPAVIAYRLIRSRWLSCCAIAAPNTSSALATKRHAFGAALLVPPIHRHNERRESRIDVEHGQAYHGRTRTQRGKRARRSPRINRQLATAIDAPGDDAFRALVRVLARQAARELSNPSRVARRRFCTEVKS